MIHSDSGSSRGNNFSSRKGFRGRGKRPLSPGVVLRYDPADALADSDPKGTGGAEFSKDADMEVTGAGFVGGAGSVRPIQPLSTGGVAPSAASGLQAPRDEILISDAARSLSEMQMDPQVRAARLAEIRSAIESGTYDTPQRLEAAIEKMIAGWQRH
ncbi:MAG: flagellar biosynthesis anti-sigma factor FlgM [Planctomyces sp.]|nr:flagellar biosynthesis anti-sigma factor FlgM [Planctomyces sp.]